jgi:hypothetical protein
MQRRCKHAFPKIESLFFLRGPCKVVIIKSSVEKSQLRFETPACQDMKSGGEELAVEEQWQEGN